MQCLIIRNAVKKCVLLSHWFCAISMPRLLLARNRPTNRPSLSHLHFNHPNRSLIRIASLHGPEAFLCWLRTLFLPPPPPLPIAYLNWFVVSYFFFPLSFLSLFPFPYPSSVSQILGPLLHYFFFSQCSRALASIKKKKKIWEDFSLDKYCSDWVM